MKYMRYRNQEVEFESTAFHHISEHVTKAYPQEGCGVLLGKIPAEEAGFPGESEGSYLIQKVCPLTNHSDKSSAAVHFNIDPLEMYRIEKEAEKEGLTVLGVYHSHPDCNAVPSEEDGEYMIPGQFYLIVSVFCGQCDEKRGYIKDEATGEILEIVFTGQ